MGIQAATTDHSNDAMCFGVNSPQPTTSEATNDEKSMSG